MFRFTGKPFTGAAASREAFSLKKFLYSVLLLAAVIASQSCASTSTDGMIPESQDGDSSEPAITVEKENELLYRDFSLGPVQVRTGDPAPATVLVEAAFGYTDKETSAELSQRSVELRDFLKRYFSRKTRKELLPENQEKLKTEILNIINVEILESSQIKSVVFIKMDVI